MSQVAISFDVSVPMRDGVILRADVYRPTGPGPWPVLVQRTPYDKASPQAAAQLDILKAVRRGYIVVQQDTRGRFASDGEWLPWAHEHQDGYDTVEWAATLPDSNGNVGMFGGSYTGNTQWSAAVAGAPHLRAIAPQITWSDPADGIFFRGGAIEHGLNLWWSLMTAAGQYPKVAVDSGELFARLGATISDFDRLAEVTYWEMPSGAAPALTRTNLPDIGTRRALRDSSSMAEARVAGRHGEVTVPSLNVGGWYDVFLQGTLDNYIAAREQGHLTRLIVGPWEHLHDLNPRPERAGMVNYGLGSMAPPSGDGTMTGIQLDWFDQFLPNEPVETEPDPGVDIFVMGLNQWRHEQQWPLARATDTEFFLHPGGQLSTAAPTADVASSSYVYDPADPVPTTGGALVMASDFLPGAFDQQAVESRADVLVFTSDPLQQDLEITGRVSATLFAATDGPSTDWVVRLCEVDERGTSLNIVDGITRIDTESGRVDEHTIDLWSTSIVIKAGHRLRVQVTSSNFPRWDRNLNTGEDPAVAVEHRVAQQKIFHDTARPSRLVLPVVPTS
ncbi:X-Pro dipeptidyl-peptidase [Nocardia mangyaensis]|uniref:X-Pro dipeptidyl-peptidase n=2 Tax=Nocardia mangyaensis TaxID=2213200 RepID=A0A1J0W298_9NOCA|nr:X-Pro dipeptidyl-peptidase [Nocardia mangyaensis]